MKTGLQIWLEGEIAKSRSLTALAIKWGYPASYLLRWRDGAIVPELRRAAELAEKSGADQAMLWRLIAEAIELREWERAKRRGTPSPGGSAAAPLPVVVQEPAPAVAAPPVPTHRPRTANRHKRRRLSGQTITSYQTNRQGIIPFPGGWSEAA